MRTAYILRTAIQWKNNRKYRTVKTVSKSQQKHHSNRGKTDIYNTHKRDRSLSCLGIRRLFWVMSMNFIGCKTLTEIDWTQIRWQMRNHYSLLQFDSVTTNKKWKLCLSVKLNSLSRLFTSISFLVNFIWRNKARQGFKRAIFEK